LVRLIFMENIASSSYFERFYWKVSTTKLNTGRMKISRN
jgi:hypothetical protein